jgi:two-component system chemotaxis response regulator CheB
MEKQWPDVIILDVEMPRMDGITFLKKIMSEHPTPIIMCSSLTEEGSKTSLEAMRLGAIDVIAKPKVSLHQSLSEASQDLVRAIKAAAKANLKGLKPRPVANTKLGREKLTADAMLDSKVASVKSGALIAIGSSTGGTQALEAILTVLPVNIAPMLIVQHMPEKFTAAFANRLNQICDVEVKEAEDNDELRVGRVLIAPGGKHMMLQATKFSTIVKIKDGPLVTRHKPSVDVLFRSVAKYAGNKALGIILTGMGDDGARGMKEMHEVGATTIAQDAATCVVYGMPAEAVKLGGVDKIMPLQEIPDEMINHH